MTSKRMAVCDYCGNVIDPSNEDQIQFPAAIGIFETTIVVKTKNVEITHGGSLNFCNMLCLNKWIHKIRKCPDSDETSE